MALVMERPRTNGVGERAAILAYVGRAGAAPILARALNRSCNGAPGRVAVLIPDSSRGSSHTIVGSPQRCREWLIDAPSDSGIGVLCITPTWPANACNHNGIALRGHLSVAAIGSRVPSRSPEDDLAAERVADLVEEHWIPPLHLAVSRALAGLTGALQSIAMSTNEPGRVICASRGFTLCLGMREDGVVVCSDPSAILEDTEGVVFLHSGEIGVVDADGWDLLTPDAMARVRRPVVDLTWYRAWARHRDQTMGPSAPHTLEPDQTAIGGARQTALGGR